jgi:hypothetical protein
MKDKKFGIGDLKEGDSAKLTFKKDENGRKFLAALLNCENVMTHSADETNLRHVATHGFGHANSWVFSFVGEATDECKQLSVLGLEKVEKV